MSELKGRHLQVIFYLLERSFPVPASQLCSEIHININTLRKDIPQIREFLAANGLALIAKSNFGLKVDGPPDKIESCKDKVIVLSTQVLGRKGKIWYTAGIFLSREEIPTIEDLCEILSVSRPTAVGYIHEVKEWFSERGIRLCSKPGFGYYIEALEEDTRDAIIESIKNLVGFEFRTVASEFVQGRTRPNLLGITRNTNLDAIRGLIDEVQAQTRKRFTDEDVLLIAITVAVSISRIKASFKVTFDQKKTLDILMNPVTLALKNSIKRLEDEFQLSFADDEIAYLALRFISVKTQELEPFDTSPRFNEVAQEIVSLASELVGLPMNAENEFILMLAHHLESAVADIRIGARIENPSLVLVKKEHPVPYNIAERASKVLEHHFHLTIPDEEIGYIAIYFAVFLEKLNQPSKKRVAINCPTGVITSRLLRYKLTSEIPEIEVTQGEALEEHEGGRRLQEEVDFVVSTVPLAGLDIPYVIVSPFLSTEDKKLIRAMLRTDRKESLGKMTARVLDENLLLLKVDAGSSADVIELLGSTLIKYGFARDNLVDSVLAREKEFPTGIKAKIPFAIPHTAPEFTVKKGLAVATLKHPVKFREMGNPERSLDVSIVLMPALTGKESDEKEFYRMLQLLEDPRVASSLLQSHSAQEVKKLLQENPATS
jgi:transcriptional antiterminator/mannitol/fructose-specific phosphotransferase system IIA component